MGVLSRDECLRFVERAPYGRIIYTSGALPAVCPVGFRLDGDVLVFDVDRTSPLAEAFRDAVLAFQIDHVDLDRGDAWSVTMTGRARELAAPSGQPVGSGFLRLGLTPELIAGQHTCLRSAVG